MSEKLTSTEYFYLNFVKIKVDGKLKSPILRDGDRNFFKQIEEWNKQEKPVLILGKRTRK